MPDWSAGPRPPKFESTAESFERPVQLARPTDRLAAVIVDVFIVLTPVFILLSAPVKRWLTTSFILGAEPDFFLTILILVALAAGLVIGYQSLTHYFFGATLGKRLFGLKVEPMFAQQRLTYWDCFFRAAVWVFEVFCLGLPWLGVFSNSKRRPLHDRICDTVVVTRSTNGVSGPLPWERGMVRGLFAACLSVAALALVVEVRGVLDKMKMEHAILSIADKDTASCEAVNPYVSEGDEDDHARLKMAMALYAAGLAERSCLESEVEREVALQVPVASVTYLAQAFVYADDAEVSNSYLDKVCADEPDSVECSMSHLVSSWSGDDWNGVTAALKSAPAGSGYLEVWGVRHYMKQAQYGDALALLDGLLSRRELGEFSMVQRVKALFNTYHEGEAQAALAQALVALPKEEGVTLGAWVCAQQLQNGCEAMKSAACRQLPSVKGAPIDFNDSPEALAQVLSMECKTGQSVDYLRLSEDSKDENWSLFFRANLKRQREDRSASAALFTKVIAAPSSPDFLRIEATRRLLQFATQRQTETVITMWSQFDSKEAWVKTGNMLFNRLAEQKNPELALKVARHLMNAQSLSPKGMSTLTAMVESAPSERRPANVKVREQVKQLLDALGEEH